MPILWMCLFSFFHPCEACLRPSELWCQRVACLDHMATRAAAQKPDGSRREVVRRVRVWKRALLRVSDTASTLASYQWVQTCTPLS